MPDTPKIFGQQKPTLLVNTNLFTVTVGRTAQISIFVANQSNNYDRFTIALVPFNTSQQVENYIAFSTPLSSNGVIAFSGIFLNSGDQVWVSTELGQCSFTATGIEFS